jgi:uncharacterized membrane protein YhhN
MSLPMPALVLLCAATALAMVQGVCFATRGPSLGKSVVKTASVAALVLVGLLADAPGLIVAGLALGAFGDLGLSLAGTRAFLAGMAAFAAGHLCYAAAFLELGAGIPPGAAILALLALGASTEVWLAPHTGALRWPVRGYVAVIVAMALAATGLPAGWTALTLGVLAFVASDLVLALEMFVLRDRALKAVAKRLLWVLYWGGQALIVLGSLPA